jgi:hypothetical protein
MMATAVYPAAHDPFSAGRLNGLLQQITCLQQQMVEYLVPAVVAAASSLIVFQG